MHIIMIIRIDDDYFYYLCRFEFMENCWEFEPECRPNFSQLVEELTEYWDDKYGYY